MPKLNAWNITFIRFGGNANENKIKLDDYFEYDIQIDGQTLYLTFYPVSSKCMDSEELCLKAKININHEGLEIKRFHGDNKQNEEVALMKIDWQMWPRYWCQSKCSG